MKTKPPTVDAARAEGLAAAQVAAEHAGETWFQWAYTAFCCYARADFLREFTTEDVRFSDPLLPVAPPDARAWGHVAQHAKQSGIVEACGFSPARSSHGSPKTLWRLRLH